MAKHLSSELRSYARRVLQFSKLILAYSTLVHVDSYGDVDTRILVLTERETRDCSVKVYT